MNLACRPTLRVPSRRCYFLRAKSDITGLLKTGKLKIHPEVAHALEVNRSTPRIVALESAIVTHGLPAPINFTTAVDLENIVRNSGATPATIAVIDGAIHVGLSRDQLSRLSDISECNSKLSRRDLASAMSQKITGGTTCAATMFIAKASGIDVFATGGLGGVHRGGHSSVFRISSSMC